MKAKHQSRMSFVPATWADGESKGKERHGMVGRELRQTRGAALRTLTSPLEDRERSTRCEHQNDLEN